LKAGLLSLAGDSPRLEWFPSPPAPRGSVPVTGRAIVPWLARSRGTGKEEEVSAVQVRRIEPRAQAGEPGSGARAAVLVQKQPDPPSWLQGLTLLDQANLIGSSEAEVADGEEVEWSHPPDPGGSTPPAGPEWLRRCWFYHRACRHPVVRDTVEALRRLEGRIGIPVTAFLPEAFWEAWRRCRIKTVGALAKYTAGVLRSLVFKDAWCNSTGRPGTEVLADRPEIWGLWAPLGRDGRTEAVHMALRAMEDGAYGQEGVDAARVCRVLLDGKASLFTEAAEALGLEGEAVVAAQNAAIAAMADALEVARAEEDFALALEDGIYEECARAVDAVLGAA
jgi:hypothetical protein